LAVQRCAVQQVKLDEALMHKTAIVFVECCLRGVSFSQF
jgi:hypothetical protein